MIVELAETAVEVLQVVTAALVLAFPPIYHVRTRGLWRMTTEGQFIMWSNVTFGAILLLGVMVVLVGPEWVEWVGRPFIRLGVYGSLAAVFGRQIVLVVRGTRGQR